MIPISVAFTWNSYDVVLAWDHTAIVLHILPWVIETIRVGTRWRIVSSIWKLESWIARTVLGAWCMVTRWLCQYLFASTMCCNKEVKIGRKCVQIEHRLRPSTCGIVSFWLHRSSCASHFTWRLIPGLHLLPCSRQANYLIPIHFIQSRPI